jgi:hypothetical protein
VARTLEEFPAVDVSTVYGTVLLPPTSSFYFKSITLSTKFSDMRYDGLKSGAVSISSDEGQIDVTGVRAESVHFGTKVGQIYASAVELKNKTKVRDTDTLGRTLQLYHGHVPACYCGTQQTRWLRNAQVDPAFGTTKVLAQGKLNATSTEGRIELGVVTPGKINIVRCEALLAALRPPLPLYGCG